VSGVTEANTTEADYTAAIAAELKAEKAASALTIDALAESTGISSRQVVRILRGERTANYSLILAFCDAFKLDISDFNRRVQDRYRKQRGE